MSTSTNIIPQLYAKGSFEAYAPFDTVVDASAFYTVEDTVTPAQMLARKIDLYATVWEPAGADDADYQQQLSALTNLNGAIIVLSSKNGSDVYVPSTHIKSFPLVDGVIYEHLCIITDCGAVPPAFKDVLNSGIDHFNNYMKDNYGLANPRTVLGTIQTRGYVSKDQADAWENTRQQQIQSNPSDLIRLNAALATIAQQTAYIAELEDALKAKATAAESTSSTDSTDNTSDDTKK